MDYKQLIGLSLREAVDKLPKATNVRLGTVNGSGFFWIGTAGDLAMNVWHVSHELKNVLLAAAEKNIKQVSKRTPLSFGAWAAAQLKANLSGAENKVDMVHYDLYVDDYNKKTQNSIEYAAMKIELCNKFTPIENRTVNDAFEACKVIEEPDCVVITISGDESGAWWYTGEKDEQTATAADGKGTGDWRENFKAAVRTPKST